MIEGDEDPTNAIAPDLLTAMFDVRKAAASVAWFVHALRSRLDDTTSDELGEILRVVERNLELVRTRSGDVWRLVEEFDQRA